EEICIIRQLLEVYPKILEKQLKEIQEKDTSKEEKRIVAIEIIGEKDKNVIIEPIEVEINSTSKNKGKHNKPSIQLQLHASQDSNEMIWQ
ncbi:38151_t:CDS:2, partial [Gigaspora margarita]